MLNVGTNVFGSPLTTADGAQPGATAGFPSAAGFASGRAPAGDNITAPFGTQAATAGADAGSAFGSAAFGTNGFLGQFMSLIENAFSQLASLFSQNLGGATPATPSGAAPGNEQCFTNATASSVGDPHDAFDGTTTGGQNEDAKWNGMSSHPDLLVSDSFAGGFRVSTTVGAPNQRGVTQNESATITSNGGQNVVTMNADGSYSISSGGRQLNMTAGQTVSLGNGETATLEPGGKLSVTQTNNAGGTITTTLAANGKGGVNVEATAQDVDLGGYLVNGSGATPGGGGATPGGGGATPGGGSTPGGAPQPGSPGGAPTLAPFGGMPGWPQAPAPAGPWNGPQLPASPAMPADPLGSPEELLGT